MKCFEKLIGAEVKRIDFLRGGERRTEEYMSRPANVSSMVHHAKDLFSIHSFAALLGVQRASLLPQEERSECTFSYRVIGDPCKAIGPKRGVLPVSSALALFDELSTYAFIAEDATSRPGVSVHLNSEILKPIEAGSSVRVRTDVRKIGATLGYCDCYIYSETSDELLARGQHIKYLPMGPLWNLIGNKGVLPSLIPFLQKQGTDEGIVPLQVGRFILKNIFGVENIQTFDYEETYTEFGRAFDAIEVSRKNTPETTAVKKKDEGSDGTGTTASYSFALKPTLTNVLGALHGGCIGMACEQACSIMLADLDEAAASSSSKKRKKRSESYGATWLGEWMDVRYISHAPGEMQVTCRLLERPHEDIAIFEGEIHAPKRKNRLTNQFKIRMRRQTF